MKEQLLRIQQKLAQAKEADKNLEVFYYNLGTSKRKKQYIDTFIKGLQDTDNNVLRTVIALSEIEDERLLPYYKAIAKRFPEEKDYILSNLKRRLASFGLTVEQARK